MPLGKAEPFRTSGGRAASACIAGSADVSSALSAGGLATTGYGLAALRAANFLGHSILGHLPACRLCDAAPLSVYNPIFDLIRIHGFLAEKEGRPICLAWPWRSRQREHGAGSERS